MSLFFSGKDRTNLLACLLASIQPRTSPSKFGGKYSILFTGVLIRARDGQGVLRSVVLVEDVPGSELQAVAVAGLDIPAARRGHDELRRRAVVPGIRGELLRHDYGLDVKICGEVAHELRRA